MKNKRNVLIAFILICCLCLSIGYAALTDTLIINGSASATAADDNNDQDGSDTLEEAFDDNLGFTAVKQGTGNSTNVTLSNTTPSVTSLTTTESTFDMTDEVTFSASGFAKKGDKAVITYTISNRHPDLSASVSAPSLKAANGTDEFTSNYFSVSTDWGTENKTIAATTGTQTVTVTVEMIKTPVENQTASFKLTFTATAQEAASGTTTE